MQKMNDVQRQILADELDEVSRTIQRYEEGIAKLEKQLRNKRTALEKHKERRDKLQEGVDW